MAHRKRQFSSCVPFLEKKYDVIVVLAGLQSFSIYMGTYAFQNDVYLMAHNFDIIRG